MKSYIVYRHIDPTGKSYIGITSIPPEKRWKNGFGYRTQKKFFSAIVSIGWSNFKHEILHTGLSEKEARLKETELIIKFNSIKEGYNTQPGYKPNWKDGLSEAKIAEEIRRRRSEAGRVGGKKNAKRVVVKDNNTGRARAFKSRAAAITFIGCSNITFYQILKGKSKKYKHLIIK